MWRPTRAPAEESGQRPCREIHISIGARGNAGRFDGCWVGGVGKRDAAEPKGCRLGPPAKQWNWLHIYSQGCFIRRRGWRSRPLSMRRRCTACGQGVGLPARAHGLRLAMVCPPPVRAFTSARCSGPCTAPNSVAYKSGICPASARSSGASPLTLIEDRMVAL